MTSPSAPAQSGTRSVVVEPPKLALEQLGPTPEEAVLRLKQFALVELFRRGEVSCAWAAEKLEVSKDSFWDLLTEHDVPYVDLSEEGLR